MTLPIGELGVGAVSGGAVVAFVMKMLPILMRKINGGNRYNRNDKNNVKPGTAATCIKQGLKIKEHDMAIVGLCGDVTRIEKQMELAHKEDREDHQLMFIKLDKLKGNG